MKPQRPLPQVVKLRDVGRRGRGRFQRFSRGSVYWQMTGFGRLCDRHHC